MTKTKSRCARLLVAVALATATAGVAAIPAHAMQVAAPDKTRTVTGHVIGKDGGQQANAVVYLKDTKTLAVRSFVADSSGSYHFNQLSQNTDYDLYAEWNGQRSKVKRISSFNDRLELDYDLKL